MKKFRSSIYIGRHRLSFVLLLSLASLFSLLYSCKQKTSEQAGESVAINENEVILTDAQFGNADLGFVKLSEVPMASLLRLNGKMEVPPENYRLISSTLGGYVKKSDLVPGMRVSKGQVLALMENPQYIQLQQEYLTAKTNFRFAEQNYNRQKELNISKANSDKTLELAELEMNSQQILMQSLAEQLKQININPSQVNNQHIIRSVPIYSPINGFVSAVKVHVGAFVNPEDVLFELINPNEMYLNIKLYEKDLGNLQIGQAVMAYSNTAEDKKYPGKIKFINRTLDELGQADVQVALHAGDAKLVPGLYMNAEIQTHNHLQWALPEEAVLDFEGKTYVFVEKGKQHYFFEEVQVGPMENGQLPVLHPDPLKGKTLVSKNAYVLLMKLKNSEEE